MKRIVLSALALTLVPIGAGAQTTAQMIEQALMAAPARAREATAVIKWNADFTYETIKEGDGPMVCYHRSDEARRPAFAVQCTSKANLERVAQSRRFRAESADAQAERAMVAAAEDNGTRVLPEYGSAWISLNGDDPSSARRHMTIAVPGGTMASTGLPESGAGGGAWIMNAGTSTAHIMIPGT